MPPGSAACPASRSADGRRGAPPPPAAVQPATVERYERERVVVQTTTGRPGFLVLTDLYAPAGRRRSTASPPYSAAYLPGRADRQRHAPGGVRLRPPAVHLGRLISLGALAVLVAAALLLWAWPWLRRAGHVARASRPAV